MSSSEVVGKIYFMVFCFFLLVFGITSGYEQEEPIQKAQTPYNAGCSCAQKPQEVLPMTKEEELSIKLDIINAKLDLIARVASFPPGEVRRIIYSDYPVLKSEWETAFGKKK